MSYPHASAVAAAQAMAAFLAGSGRAQAAVVRERAERAREMLPSPRAQSRPGSRSFTR
jgi:hypothetical protein